MATIIKRTPLNLSVEDKQFYRNDIVSHLNSPYRWSIIGGGALVGAISALVLGVIFGPLAAIISFFLTGIGCSSLVAIVTKQSKNEVLFNLKNRITTEDNKPKDISNLEYKRNIEKSENDQTETQPVVAKETPPSENTTPPSSSFSQAHSSSYVPEPTLAATNESPNVPTWRAIEKKCGGNALFELVRPGLGLWIPQLSAPSLQKYIID